VGDISRKIFLLLGLPAFDLLDTAAGVLVKGNIIVIDKLGVSVFDKQIVVFGIVLT